jgi:anti-sigma factor RsiW
MRCGDLERYLEAFLDGRLGRNRSAVLRRHLALCAGCQARVERLRQFERDTQRRFRSPELPGSVWEGLELDLVGSSGAMGGHRLLAAPRVPPVLPRGDGSAERAVVRRAPGHPAVAAARPSARGTASRLAGVLLVALALGAAYQLVRGEFRATTAASAAQAYLDHRRDGGAPALGSGQTERVAEWLTVELGRPVPPPPVPEGYHVVGATHADLAGGVAGVVIYARDAAPEAEPVMLFVRPEGAGLAAAPAATPEAAGLSEVHWAADGLSYVAVGPVGEEQLLRFQR